MEADTSASYSIMIWENLRNGVIGKILKRDIGEFKNIYSGVGEAVGWRKLGLASHVFLELTGSSIETEGVTGRIWFIDLLNRLKDLKMKLLLEKTATRQFCRLPPVIYSLKDGIKTELDW